MSRRSTRLLESKTKHTAPQVIRELGSSEEIDDVSESLPVSKISTSRSKRRKTAKTSASAKEDTGKPRKKRGRQGILQDIQDAPLDILFEIFLYLEPLDLLRLSRTSKDINRILLSKSSAFIWREALAKVEGLPETPPGLNEVQYASLAFDSFCHLCPAPNCHAIALWDMRMRCCAKCLDDREGVFRTSIVVNKILKSLSVPLPHPNSAWHYLPCQGRGTGHSGRALYYFPHVQQFCDGLEKSVKGKKNKSKYGKSFFAETEDALEIVRTHARLCKKWEEQCQRMRVDAQKEARARRRQAIIDRLTELGWGDNFAKLPQDVAEQFRSHKLVNQPKDLTDRIWSNIQETLIEFLTVETEKRLTAERSKALRDRNKHLEQVYKKYLAAQTLDFIAPPIADIALSDPFRALIYDTPYSEDLTLSQIESFASKHMPTVIAAWREAKDAELVEILKTYLPGATTAHLHLATTVFICTVDKNPKYSSYYAPCRELLTYPRVLSHSCASQYDSWVVGENSEWYRTQLPDDASMVAFFLLRSMLWNTGGDRVGFSVEGSRSACAAVEACGLDPNVATVQDMDGLNPLVECRSCKDLDDGKDRLVMRWMRALQHDHGSSSPVFTTQDLSEKDRTYVVEKEHSRKQVDIAKLLMVSGRNYSSGFDVVCTHCSSRFRSSEGKTCYNVRDHFRHSHGIRELTQKDWSWGLSTRIVDLTPEPVRIGDVIVAKEGQPL